MFYNGKRFAAGLVEAGLHVKQGRIVQCFFIREVSCFSGYDIVFQLLRKPHVGFFFYGQ